MTMCKIFFHHSGKTLTIDNIFVLPVSALKTVDTILTTRTRIPSPTSSTSYQSSSPLSMRVIFVHLNYISRGRENDFICVRKKLELVAFSGGYRSF